MGGELLICVENQQFATHRFMDEYEWKGERDYREWCVPPVDLKTRIISIH